MLDTTCTPELTGGAKAVKNGLAFEKNPIAEILKTHSDFQLQFDETLGVDHLFWKTHYVGDDISKRKFKAFLKDLGVDEASFSRWEPDFAFYNNVSKILYYGESKSQTSAGSALEKNGNIVFRIQTLNNVLNKFGIRVQGLLLINTYLDTLPSHQYTLHEIRASGVQVTNYEKCTLNNLDLGLSTAQLRRAFEPPTLNPKP